MTCRDFADFLVDYVDNELPPRVKRQFESHLEECQDCVSYLRQYSQTIRLVASAGNEDLLPSMPEDLVRAIVLSARG